MPAWDLKSAPAAFLQNGTFTSDSEVYKWYHAATQQAGNEANFTSGTLSVKWTSNDLVLQWYAEYKDYGYKSRMAWEQVWRGSFGPTSRNMNGESQQNQSYQAYHSYMMQPTGEVADGGIYQTAGGTSLTIKNGAINFEHNGQPTTDKIPANIWSKYFSSFFSATDPISINGVHVLNYKNGTHTTITDCLTGVANQADALTFNRPPDFAGKRLDKVTNFNPKENDKLQIVLSKFGKYVTGTLKIIETTKDLKDALSTKNNFIYLKGTGELYFNANGVTPGFGNGGVFAVIEGKPSMGEANIGFI